MVNEDAKVRWSKLRDVVFGKLTHPEPLGDNKQFNVNSEGYASNRNGNFILQHGKNCMFLVQVRYYATILGMKYETKWGNFSLN